jgi:hypothetical protein
MFTAKQGWVWYTETTAQMSNLMRWSLLAIACILAVLVHEALIAFTIGALAFMALDVLQQFVRAYGFKAAAELAEKYDDKISEARVDVLTGSVKVSMSDEVLRLTSRLFLAKVSLFFGIIVTTAVILGWR